MRVSIKHTTRYHLIRDQVCKVAERGLTNKQTSSEPDKWEQWDSTWESMLRQSETKIGKETCQATPSAPDFPACGKCIVWMVRNKWSYESCNGLKRTLFLWREKEKCLKYCLISNSMLKVSLYPARILHVVSVYENTPWSSKLLPFQGYVYHLYRQFCANLLTATMLG